MLGTSPPGLTARDFHPPSSFINPRDVFPVNSRQRARPSIKNVNLNQPKKVQNSIPQTDSSFRLSCCGEDTDLKVNGCIRAFSAEDIHDAPSPDSCSGDCDKCEDCFEDHKECDEDQIPCVDQCDECLDEHDKACGQQGQVCTETCDDCDFSCFDCVDWNAFEQDKTLGLSHSVPLLGPIPGLSYDDYQNLKDLTVSTTLPEPDQMWVDTPVPPVNLSMHHQCLQNSMPFWTGTVLSQFCPDMGNTTSSSDANHLNMPASSVLPTSYGCHPAAVHNTSTVQKPLPTYNSTTAIQQTYDWTMPNPTWEPAAETPSAADTPNPSIRVCQWVMPCGSTCSASFASASDLRKHVKSVHCVKGTTKCSWASCHSSTFATEAALTGHISKKHLSSALTDSDGPFKCTFPGCTKSFMYKQVRDDHIASHNGGNKMYCHICDQFLNSEGSNFRRHMANHRPKHQHMICKYHHLGCKRRFPRLDNLRRHEAGCKFMKKAALHHHHFHKHVGH